MILYGDDLLDVGWFDDEPILTLRCGQVAIQGIASGESGQGTIARSESAVYEMIHGGNTGLGIYLSVA